jgi:hypothetical protein
MTPDELLDEYGNAYHVQMGDPTEADERRVEDLHEELLGLIFRPGTRVKHSIHGLGTVQKGEWDAGQVFVLLDHAPGQPGHLCYLTAKNLELADDA